MLRLTFFSVITIMSVAIYSCGQQAEDQNAQETDSIPEQSAVVDTVNNPRMVEQGSNGDLLLTAETGKAGGPDIKYMPEWRAFGWFTAADSVIWDIDVKNAGKYDVYLDWSVSDEEAGKTFLLQSGDQQITGEVGKSGSWETFKTEKIGELDLKAGTQQVLFKSKTKFDKGALLDLRQIRLARK